MPDNIFSKDHLSIFDDLGLATSIGTDGESKTLSILTTVLSPFLIIFLLLFEKTELR